jgi:predicted TIM-barrel fold metal-dependent hydrolase
MGGTMSKVIDLKMDLPPNAIEMAQRMEYLICNRDGKGVANYRRIFGPQWAAALGMKFENLEKKSRELPTKEFKDFLVGLAQRIVPSHEQFVSQLEVAGIEWCLIDDPDNDKTRTFIQHAPDRLKGSFAINPHEGLKGVEAAEKAIKEHGFMAMYATSFLWKIEASDQHFYPFYAKAAELKVPVFIYTTMNYNTELSMDIAHPIHIDRIAMDFPKLKIVASSGGWPWVPDLVGVARRHQNVFIDTSSHRPKYIATPGSGFEMLLQFGNTLLQDQMVFGSGVGDLGLPIGQVIKEMWKLPLKDTVKEKWLYSNAKRLFE